MLFKSLYTWLTAVTQKIIIVSHRQKHLYLGILLEDNLNDELALKWHENSLHRRGNALFPTLKIAPQRSNIIYSRRCAKKKAHILFHAAYPYLWKSPDPSYCSEGQIRRLVNREWTKALYKGHKYRSMTCIITLCSEIKICYVMLYSIISKFS